MGVKVSMVCKKHQVGLDYNKGMELVVNKGMDMVVKVAMECKKHKVGLDSNKGMAVCLTDLRLAPKRIVLLSMPTWCF